MAGGQTTDKELQLLQTVDLLPHLSLAEVYKLLPHNAAKWRARARKLEKKGLLTTLKRGQVGGFLGKPTDAGYARLDVAAMANRQQLDADSFVLVRLLYGEELEQARNATDWDTHHPTSTHDETRYSGIQNHPEDIVGADQRYTLDLGDPGFPAINRLWQLARCVMVHSVERLTAPFASAPTFSFFRFFLLTTLPFLVPA